MKSFKTRSHEKEIMDGQGVSFAEYLHCMRSLEIINILTLAYCPTLKWLKPFLKQPGRNLHILDIGSGGGDMLRRIEKLARRYGQPVILTGLDLDPMAKRVAEILTDKNSAINFISADIFDYRPDKKIDIVLCSLFTHHLDEGQIVRFLRWLDQNTQQGWFINDLHRHFLPYYFIKAATMILSRNRLIRNDAPLSVARSFQREDWQNILRKANINHPAEIKWHFPFRLCISCRK